MEPTSRVAEASLGKIPATRDRLLVSLLMRSRGLVDQAVVPVATTVATDAGRATLSRTFRQVASK